MVQINSEIVNGVGVRLTRALTPVRQKEFRLLARTIEWTGQAHRVSVSRCLDRRDRLYSTDAEDSNLQQTSDVKNQTQAIRPVFSFKACSCSADLRAGCHQV